MAYFAELAPDDIVLRVLVVANADCIGPDGEEDEATGIAFLERLFGGRWLQTSYNARIRKNYAGPGMTYDSVRDAFIHPRPYPSWLLDEATCQWVPPVPYPSTPGMYDWDEATQNWVPVA